MSFEFSSFIDIFDGIDEISFTYANRISEFIKKLSGNNTTYAIILTSRTNSPNVTILKSILNDIDEFQLEKLDHSYIDKYFDVQQNETKKLRYIYK